MNYLILGLGALALLTGCSTMDGLFAGETNTSETQNTIAEVSSSSVLSSVEYMSSEQVNSSEGGGAQSSSTILPSSSEVFSSESSEGMNFRLQNASGEIAAKVPVTLVSQSGWENGLFQDSLIGSHSLISDDSGNVYIPALAEDNWSLLIEHEQEGLFMALTASIDGDTVATGPLTEHNGNVGGYVPKNSEICLQSTPFCSAVSDAGDFAFDAVPDGNFDLAFVDDASETITVVNQYKLRPGGEEVDSIYYEQNHITLEDFQDKDHFGSLSTWGGNGQWWQHAEGASYWPSNNTQMELMMVTGPGGDGDWAYQQQITFVDYENLQWMNLGLNFGEGADAVTSSVWADISAMDSITFAISGTGKFEFFIQSAYTLEDHLDFYVPVALGGGWHEVTIRAENFIRRPGSLVEERDIDFKQAATRTAAVVFRFLDEGNFIIDNIKIHGIEVIHFYPGSDTGE
ncbi:MAG: hypothetical protein OCD01_06400 [Fibrobacterales bacterium]